MCKGEITLRNRGFNKGGFDPFTGISLSNSMGSKTDRPKTILSVPKQALSHDTIGFGRTYHAEFVAGRKELRNIPPGIRMGLVILISSDTIGSGDPVFGRALMRSMLYGFAESVVLPQTVVIMNSAVKLVTEDKQCIDMVRKLEKNAVEVLVSATCLKYYNLTELLEVGVPVATGDIVDRLVNSENTIKL